MIDKGLVFDVGMYDGRDTQYYLELGFRVVAIEANPERVAEANTRFAKPLSEGKLHVVNAALAESAGEVTLHVCARDAGSSSLFPDRVGDVSSTYTVPTVRLQSILAERGTPHYLKVDIEGADRFAILSLSSDALPQYVSFEVGGDFDELLGHLGGLGYSEFKIIHQGVFREMERVDSLGDRIADKWRRILGKGEPKARYRSGRAFSIGCSGPVPWSTDGRWRNFEETRARWHQHLKTPISGGWWDVHARLTPSE